MVNTHLSDAGPGSTSPVWARTSAGQLEISARTVLTQRAQRHLLLAIDGVASEEMLQASLSGLADIAPMHFQMLSSLGLIAPVPRRILPPDSQQAPGQKFSAKESPLSFIESAAVLTQTIFAEFGVLGLRLTLAVEKASCPSDLQEVANHTVARIRRQRGEAAAAAAARKLGATSVEGGKLIETGGS